MRLINYCGKHSLIHAPITCRYACIGRYLQKKVEDPCNTSACILVPAWEHAKFRDLLTESEFYAVFSAKRVAAKYANLKRQARFHHVKVFISQIWYDPCRTVMHCKNIADETDKLLMAFPGKLKQDMSASILSLTVVLRMIL